jgi:HEAT repeat protein
MSGTNDPSGKDKHSGSSILGRSNNSGMSVDWAARIVTAWKQGEISSHAAVEELRAAAQQEDRHLRRAAVWALGEIRSTEAVDALREALGDEDRKVRRAAVWALGQIDSEDVVPDLEAALQDNDKAVRRGAREALARKGHGSRSDPAEELSSRTQARITDVDERASGLATETERLLFAMTAELRDEIARLQAELSALRQEVADLSERLSRAESAGDREDEDPGEV